MNVRSIRCLVITIALAACAGSDAPTGPDGSEPSRGAFKVKTRTTGVERDVDGYTVLIAPVNTPGSLSFNVGVNDSIVVTHERLGSHPSYYMQLRGMATNCWPTPLSWTQADIVWNEVTSIEFNVECIASSRVRQYDRVTPNSAVAIAFHGTLSELYALTDDGRFRLQYTSARVGVFEYIGAFTQTPNELNLTFEGDTRWQAVAVLRNDSLGVAYNEVMVNSDFEHGVFVRRTSSMSF